MDLCGQSAAAESMEGIPNTGIFMVVNPKQCVSVCYSEKQTENPAEIQPNAQK